MTKVTSHRWMKWALIASVAVNFAVVAAVIGALATGGPDRRSGAERHHGGPPEIAALARGLEREDRQALFRALRANGRLAGGRERMAAARVAIADALEADPFNPAVFEAALRDHRMVQTQLSARGQSVLSDFLADLPIEKRLALAARLRAALERRR